MYVRHLKNIDNVGICSCMWVNWMRQQSVRSPWDWGLWFWGGETWCGVSTGGAAEERGYLREVWGGNEKKETWLSHLFIFMTNLYIYTISVSVATENFSWAELVRLWNCAGYLYAYQLFVWSNTLPVFSPGCTDDVFELLSLFIYRLKT